jgi:hypothetical protein
MKYKYCGVTKNKQLSILDAALSKYPDNFIARSIFIEDTITTVPSMQKDILSCGQQTA